MTTPATPLLSGAVSRPASENWPRGAGLIDVLNGGWWARRIAETNLQNLQPISEGVRSMCKWVMANG